MNDSTSLTAIAARIGRHAAWAPLAVLLLHGILGLVYGHEPYVDPASHLLGGVAVAYFVRQSSRYVGGMLGSPSALALDLLAFGLTTVAALAWELGEFASDVFRGTRIQYDVPIVMRDLMLGVGGAMLYLAVARSVRTLRKGRDEAGTRSPGPDRDQIQRRTDRA